MEGIALNTTKPKSIPNYKSNPRKREKSMEKNEIHACRSNKIENIRNFCTLNVC